MPSTATNNRKRKAGSSSTSKTQTGNGKNAKRKTEQAASFPTWSLEEILTRISNLSAKVPLVPDDSFGLVNPTAAAATTETGEEASTPSTSQQEPPPLVLREEEIRNWASSMQEVLEEFNLLVTCVSTATYKWGTDRSGAADQNLSLLSGELSSSQDQISSTVSPRLSNVLAPVVDLVIDKTVTTKDSNGNEVKQNYFCRKVVDPDFYLLCHNILGRNATMLRQVVLSNFHKLMKCIQDYLNAQKNDTQHGRGLAY